MSSDVICDHLSSKNGICTECGLVLNDILLEDTYFKPTSQVPIGNKKYVLGPDPKRISKKIDKILIPLNLMNLKEQVEDIISNTDFKVRLNIENKIVTAVYHILKSNSFPISTNDLLKYSSMKKHKLLKAHRDSFEFSIQTTDFYDGILKRALDFFNKKGFHLKYDPSLLKFCIQNMNTSDPMVVCYAYLLETNNIFTSRIWKEADFSYYQINTTRRKLKNILYKTSS